MIRWLKHRLFLLRKRRRLTYRLRHALMRLLSRAKLREKRIASLTPGNRTRYEIESQLFKLERQRKCDEQRHETIDEMIDRRR